jgi:hypothetical protein
MNEAVCNFETHSSMCNPHARKRGSISSLWGDCQIRVLQNWSIPSRRKDNADLLEPDIEEEGKALSVGRRSVRPARLDIQPGSEYFLYDKFVVAMIVPGQN